MGDSATNSASPRAMKPLLTGENGDQSGDWDEPRDQDDDVYMSERETQCGIGSWRPAWLQPCNNLRMFTACLAMWSLFGSINFSYYTAVITSIERQFGLSSSTTGFIKNVDNIGFMVCTILVAHFFRYSNKPRLFAVATVITSCAIFIFALPHFIYGGVDEIANLNISFSPNATMKDDSADLCRLRDPDRDTCNTYGALRASNMGALALFVVSELLQGMGQSPKFTMSITYMDDNGKDKSPKYFGYGLRMYLERSLLHVLAFMFASRAFAPVIGFAMGAWTSTLYVDLSPTDLNPRDPRWIGAWWLGFVICAVISSVWVIPILLFPPYMKQKEQEPSKAVTQTTTEQSNDKLIRNGVTRNPRPGYKRPKEESEGSMVKDLPKALWRLVKNPLYLIVLIATCIEIYMMGFATFMPKYFHSYYGISVAMASMLTGILGALSFSLGPVISGQLVSRFKLTPYTSMRFVVIMTGLSILGYIAMFFIKCPAQKWAGTLHTDNAELSMNCNSNCSCSDNNFLPVCGSDNVNYFSACHAGCTESVLNGTTKTYSGCGCVEGGEATLGTCGDTCLMVIPYGIAVFFTKFVGSMDIVPKMATLMRCVHPRDKALSLSTFSALIMIAAFPAPMVFGLLIDWSCLVKQTSCSTSRKGACLLYDPDVFRMNIHGFALGIKVVAFLLYLVALRISRNIHYHDEDTKEDANKTDVVTTVNDAQVDTDKVSQI